MRTFIATTMAAFAFMFNIANANAATVTNANPKVHAAHRTEALVRITPTHRCRCYTCIELNRHHNNPHFAANAKAERNCKCPTCNDIRHNEHVMMHRAPMAKPAPAPMHNHAAPVPTRKGADKMNNTVAGRR